jgi:ribosomal-protein-alanine N-acetyltransferase
MHRFPHLEAPLDDGVVLVRDAAERDIPEVLIAYEDDPELHLRLGEERPPSGAQLGRLAETETADRAAGVRAALTILDPGSDVCRGQIYVHHVDWDHARAEVGIWLDPRARGRGLGRRALRLASAWLLAECAIERIQLLTDPGNEPMLRAAAGAGYVQEGVLTGYLRKRGRRVDAAILSLLPEDLK